MKVVEIDVPPNPLSRRFVLDAVYGEGFPRSFGRENCKNDMLASALMEAEESLKTVWFVGDMMTLTVSEDASWSKELEDRVCMLVKSNTPAVRKVFLLKKG